MIELIKDFRHLARDLFIYFLTGFVFLINLFYLDHLFNHKYTFIYLQSVSYWAICFVIVAYILGHLIFATTYFVFEFLGFEKWFKKIWFKEKNDKNEFIAFEICYKKEIEIFKNENGLHEQFIERHTQLYLMRWNLAGGLILTGLTNLVFELAFHVVYGLTILSIVLILVGFILYVLSIRTEKDCYDRVNEIYKINN